MTFERESQLVDRLLASADGISFAPSSPSPGTGKRCVTKEFLVDPVIPDVLVVDRHGGLPFGALRKLTRRQAHVLKRIGERPERPVTDFYEVWRGPSALTSLLSPLLRAGLISFNSEALTLSPSTALLDLARNHRVCAVEAKLTRWKDAIEQATKYHQFANQVFVALPQRVIDEKPQIFDACAAASVGLLGVSLHGVSEYRPAPIALRWTEDWIWVVAKAIGLPIVTGSPPRTRLPLHSIQAAVPPNWCGMSEYDLPPLTPAEFSQTPHAISLDA